MMFRMAMAVAPLVAAGAVIAAPASAQTVSAASDAGQWVIGPLIGRRNYSVGMPLHPTPRRGGGFEIELPQAPGSVHYVTFRHGSLAGKRRIRMRYRVEAERGTRIVASSDGKSGPLITPYFQRFGDNWRAKGRFETYRWYATFSTKALAPGEYEIIAPLAGKWTAVETSNSHTAPEAFRDAAANADQVGFVLGGGNGFGHGVHLASGRARLIVTEFRVE
jgi:hypothetical protein